MSSSCDTLSGMKYSSLRNGGSQGTAQMAVKLVTRWHYNLFLNQKICTESLDCCPIKFFVVIPAVINVDCDSIPLT